jgi:hypothetical protein
MNQQYVPSSINTILKARRPWNLLVHAGVMLRLLYIKSVIITQPLKARVFGLFSQLAVAG